MINFETVPNLLGLARMAFAALAKLLKTPPTTAAKPIDIKTTEQCNSFLNGWSNKGEDRAKLSQREKVLDQLNVLQRPTECG